LKDEANVKEVKERYADYLLKITGVTGVGYNSSIIIYVEELTPQLTAFLPRQLEGVPVKIVRTGRIQPLPLQVAPAHAVYSERTKRMRPSPGGVSCGHPFISAGTLSARAVDRKSGEVLGLSNAHVIAAAWGEMQVGQRGDPVLQPGPVDGGTLDDKIGELDRWIPVEPEPEPNLVDAAAFRSNQLREDIIELGKPDRLIEPSPGMTVLKSGRTSGVTYGRILDAHATILVEGWGRAKFVDQIIIRPAILSPGDSGSFIGQADTLRAVGLGHAGSTEVSVACHAEHVERLLNVEIAPPVGYASTLAMLGVWGGLGVASLALMR